jgi:hypothetical protein
MENTNEIINKYINDPNYIIQGGIFNINDFNKAYNIIKENKKKRIQENDINYLNKLNEENNKPKIPLYNLSILDILINIKNTINDILNDFIIDLFHLRFNINIFLKDDRLFYIGLIIIIICIILYVFILLFYSGDYFK